MGFEEGEDLRTEISAKFTRRGLEDELAAVGMRVEDFLTDRDGRFALGLAAPSSS